MSSSRDVPSNSDTMIMTDDHFVGRWADLYPQHGGGERLDLSNAEADLFSRSVRERYFWALRPELSGKIDGFIARIAVRIYRFIHSTSTIP